MTRPAKPRLPRLSAAVTAEVERLAGSAVVAAIADADARAVALTKLHEFAALHGVEFDLSGAINGSVSLAAARRQVMDAMADASEAMVTLCRSNSTTTEQANSKSGWDGAMRAVVVRHGGSS